MLLCLLKMVMIFFGLMLKFLMNVVVCGWLIWWIMNWFSFFMVQLSVILVVLKVFCVSLMFLISSRWVLVIMWFRLFRYSWFYLVVEWVMLFLQCGVFGISFVCVIIIVVVFDLVVSVVSLLWKLLVVMFGVVMCFRVFLYIRLVVLLFIISVQLILLCLIMCVVMFMLLMKVRQVLVMLKVMYLLLILRLFDMMEVVDGFRQLWLIEVLISRLIWVVVMFVFFSVLWLVMVVVFDVSMLLFYRWWVWMLVMLLSILVWIFR